MIGLVVAGHGELASHLVASARLIVGTIPHALACDVRSEDSPQLVSDSLVRCVDEVDAGHGVLVMTDILGGSPCARTLSACSSRAIEIVSGVNLPMLLKAHSLRVSSAALTLSEFAVAVADAARAAVCVVPRAR